MIVESISPKCVILNEIVIKWRGNRTEHLGKFYSTRGSIVLPKTRLGSGISWKNSGSTTIFGLPRKRLK
ncbi:hypothetical protein IX53_08340 [Kosmotoga pacifica]|uniref:Uncharacterized protein n=1 Tax=Kosmotoga pacifica TaxID=1330330 RepID=A0A0G2ZCI7_9BACT|nr:hypothetical protein IX53_08340 [Kosmotoga pacifica]